MNHFESTNGCGSQTRAPRSATLRVAALTLLLCLTACSTLNKGADPIVVRAEQSIAVAYATMNTFVQLDHANRALWNERFPEVHEYAEFMRQPVGNPPTARGLGWIEAALKAKDAYKRNRDANNKATLITALATLETFVRQTQQQLDATTPTP